MKDLGPIILLLLLIMATISMVIIVYAPTSTSYSVYNNGWNGLSRISGEPISLARDYHFLNENPANKALLIIVQRDPSEEEIRELVEFVKKGGRLIVLAENENTLLNSLGDIRVVNVSILDSLFYYKSPLLPLAIAGINGSNLTIVLNLPVYIEYSDDWRNFISTSNYSFADINGNETYESFEKRGPFTVGVYKKLGLGEVFVISDRDVFINSMLGLYNNSLLLELLRGNRSLYIDLMLLQLSPVDTLKAFIYSMEARFPSIIELILVFILALSYYFVADKESLLEERVIRRYGLAVLYIVVVSVVLLLFRFDYVLVVYSIVLTITFMLRWVGAGVIILTSHLLYLARDPVILIVLMPLVVLYPFLNYRETGIGVLFLGSSSMQSIKVLGLLLPIAILRPLELPPLALLFSSVLMWSIWEYIITGKVVVRGPSGIVEAVLNEKNLIPIDIRVDGRAFIQLKTHDLLEEIEASGDVLVNLPLSFNRLGFHRVLVEAYVLGYNRFSYRSKRLMLNVNVIPAIKKLLRVIERSMGSSIVGAGLGDLKGYGTMGREARESVRGRGLREGFEKTIKPIGITIRFVGEGLSARSKRGEYYGVREYVPGDNPKNIHWKKSLSKNELIIKEFSGGIGGTGGLGPVVVFGDLVSSSISEFDKLSYKLLSTILRLTAMNPYSEIVLFLISPYGSMEVLKGESKSILIELYRLFKREMLFVDNEYYSMSGLLDNIEVEKIITKRNIVLDAMKHAYARFYSNVLTIINKLGLNSPAYYTIIHGRPTSFKYSLLRFFMNRLGYVYLETPVISPMEASMYSSVLASVL